MDVRVTDLGHDLYLIDAGMHGKPQRLACYLFDTPERVLIECGPSVSIANLYAALDHLGIDDVATMAVTHIHLDHAGGAGHFAERYPKARIGVHSAGARHLAEPSQLWSSAARIYGEDGMRDMWGAMEPIAPERLIVLEDGDKISLGGGRSIDVVYTPGHAKHHVVYFEEITGACFVGDAVGIVFPHGHIVQPITPPPDLDPDLVAHQLHRIRDLAPAFLGFAHFGPHADPAESLAQAEERLWAWVSWVERAGAGDIDEAMRRWVLDGYATEGATEETVALYDDATFWPMQVSGIRRWLDQHT